MIKGAVKTLKDALEYNLSHDTERSAGTETPAIPATSSLMTLLVKYAAMSQRRYCVGTGSRTPYERSTGRRIACNSGIWRIYLVDATANIYQQATSTRSTLRRWLLYRAMRWQCRDTCLNTDRVGTLQNYSQKACQRALVSETPGNNCSLRTPTQYLR